MATKYDGSHVWYGDELDDPIFLVSIIMPGEFEDEDLYEFYVTRTKNAAVALAAVVASKVQLERDTKFLKTEIRPLNDDERKRVVANFGDIVDVDYHSLNYLLYGEQTP